MEHLTDAFGVEKYYGRVSKSLRKEFELDPPSVWNSVMYCYIIHCTCRWSEERGWWWILLGYSSHCATQTHGRKHSCVWVSARLWYHGRQQGTYSELRYMYMCTCTSIVHVHVHVHMWRLWPVFMHVSSCGMMCDVWHGELSCLKTQWSMPVYCLCICSL